MSDQSSPKLSRSRRPSPSPSKTEGSRRRKKTKTRERDRKDEREDDMAMTAGAEKAAKRAMKDLTKAEDEIRALQDLLRAHESDGGTERKTIRKLRDSLNSQQRTAEQLRKALRRCKADNDDEVADLLDEIEDLRRRLSSNNRHARALWPGAFCYIPSAPPSPIKVLAASPPPNGFYYTPTTSGYRRSGRSVQPHHTPSRRRLNFTTQIEAGGPAEFTSSPIQPGAPGMISVDEDGNFILVPFDGLFCNVAEHHHLEDDISTLQEEIRQKDEMIKATSGRVEELEKLLGPLEEAELKMDHLKYLITAHEDAVLKLRGEEERAAKEKIETEKELSDLKDSLGHKKKRKNQLEGRVSDLLGELRTEQALLQHEEMQDELHLLERALNKKRKELRSTEQQLRQVTSEVNRLEEQALVLKKKNENSFARLTETEQDAEELERQTKELASKLLRARNDLRQLQDEAKACESNKIKLDDQCNQLTRLVSNKEAEFTALEKKTDQMTGNLEKLQTELIVTEEKESERVLALKESEKVLGERREEIHQLKDQTNNLNEQLENLERSAGKKSTELQLLQENIDHHQNELSSVLSKGKADVLEKQKRIKQLRRDIEELTSTKSDLDNQISQRRNEHVGFKEKVEKENEQLHQVMSDVMRQKSEMKHVLEMLGLENQELESVRHQHEVKAGEVKDLQRKMFEERDELDRILSEIQRKDTDVDRLKQTLEKLRGEVECLQTERSTLDATVTSLTKEKDLLTSQMSSLDDKIKNGKTNLQELKANIEKSNKESKDIGEELSQTKQDLTDSSTQKSLCNKEVSSLKKLAKDVKSEVDSYKTELQETQDQLNSVDQDIRSQNRKRDDLSLEVTSLQEQMTSARQQLDLLQQNMRRREEEQEKMEEKLRAKKSEVFNTENELENLRRDSEREQNRLSDRTTQLKEEISSLKFELQEHKVELEQVLSKRDSAQREMERLGRVDDKFVETEAKISALQVQLDEAERHLIILEREKSDLKGNLANAEGELRALQIKSDSECDSLQHKLQESEQQNIRDAKEIKSLEDTAQDHCDRANRLSAELNDLRLELIHQKQELRYKEDEFMKQVREAGKLERKLRDELRAKDDALLLNRSNFNVDSLNELYREQRDTQKKMHALREIQRGNSPTRRTTVTPSDSSMKNLQDELQARQEEIALQIRQQMNKHKEQIEARQKQSEGKLLSLKKKLDNLDDMVSNTSMDSRVRDETLDDTSLTAAASRTQEERENHHPTKD